MFYLKLYQKYTTEILQKHSDTHNCLKKIIDARTTTIDENSTRKIKHTPNKIKSVLLSVNFETLKSNFDSLLKNQAQFFRKYIKVFGHLLLFLRETRQQI